MIGLGAFGSRSWPVVCLATAIAASGPASAQTPEQQQIQGLRNQLRQMQQQLQQLERREQARDIQTRAAQAEATRARQAAQQATQAAEQHPVNPFPPSPPMLLSPPPGVAVRPGAPAAPEAYASVRAGLSPHPSFQVGPLTITLGGFVELDSIFRARNMVADVASAWNAIPLNILPGAHESEYRMSARRSRVAALVEGFPDNESAARAFFEFDFLAAAPTSNSVQSNGYIPRPRQIYATYDRYDWGLHVLAGQAWSMITLNKIGIVPREESIPITIDQGYMAGFSYTRSPQIRLTKDFGQKIWLGFSLESPQTTFVVGPNGTGLPTGASVNFNNPGGSQFFSGNLYSTDVAPDLIVKAAFDPGYGHYEVFGLGRLLQSRTEIVGSGHNNVVPAGGAGAAFIVPLLPKDRLQLEGRFLAGAGIGRYGVGQLPDATIGASGEPVPIPEVSALIGVIGRPTPKIDLYAYVGTERESSRAFTIGGKGFGYGSPLYSNAGCDIELSTLPCTGNTSALTGGVIGAWWRFLHGNYGTFMAGASYAYVRRSVFQGIGGSPNANEQVFMTSLRYYPFE
jgi:hypothetical protein